MKHRRIIFFLRASESPSGGEDVIFTHAEILAQHGFNSFVALPQKPRIDFYESRAPLMIHGGKIRFQEGDICVIPEVFSDYMDALKGVNVKKIMFCQNHFYLPFSANPRIGLAEYPVDEIVVSSQAIKEFMGRIYGLSDPPLIPYSINTKIFYGREKIRQIAYMPRKLPKEAEFIKATFRRAHREYADVPWVPIHNKTKSETAELLGQSEVFLSLSHRESFGLPPLEAMASGCLVVGFHGDGGREYINDKNGHWADYDDWQSCVDGLSLALKLLDGGGSALQVRTQAMRATVDAYSPKRMQEALLTYWSKQILV
jgi:hypothetical protein